MRPTVFGSDSLCAEKSATLGTEGGFRSMGHPRGDIPLISKDFLGFGSGGRERSHIFRPRKYLILSQKNFKVDLWCHSQVAQCATRPWNASGSGKPHAGYVDLNTAPREYVRYAARHGRISLNKSQL